MPIGNSGRIVIELDPNLKKDLHKVLALKELTMKEWFVKQAEDYVKNHDQMKLFNS